jgi:branched-chain amino acid transport system substrate-binding protein
MKSWKNVAAGPIPVLGLSFAATSTEAEETVTIAATLGITGPGSIAAESVPVDIALQDRIAIANQEGGINGKKLRHIMKDDQYKPDVGVRLFEQLMSTDNPLAFFGSGTPAAPAVQPLLRDRYKPTFCV